MQRNPCVDADHFEMEADAEGEFLADVYSGLSKPRKVLPSKYFYDKRGSELFDRICALDEYYPTRTEIEIIRNHASDMASSLQNSNVLIEFGSGSSVKTCFLLDQLTGLSYYVPVDISAEHLESVGQAVSERYDDLIVRPLATDFTSLRSLPPEFDSAPTPHSVYFPGSTIGNFDAQQATKLLSNISLIIGGGGILLLGFDLVKDVAVLEAAYNDAQGITASFNKNILRRINAELGGDFNLDHFEHKAIWCPVNNRIEMHLRSDVDQTVTIGERSFHFSSGETICTEYSHKYDLESITKIAAISELRICDYWTDSREWFAVAAFRRDS